MIRMIVFDMAGTTVDENNAVYKSIKKAMEEFGFDFTLGQVLAEGAGKEKLQAIKSILEIYDGNHDEHLAQSIFKRFQVVLDEAYRNIEVNGQPHVLDLFLELKSKGIYIVLNTGYNSVTANNLLDKLGWKKGVEYDGLITSGDTKNNRPDPDMILLAMKQFGISTGSEVIKVGDSIIDIEEGQNAGCRFSIGITTGAHTRQQLETAHPDFIIDDLLEVLPVIDKA